MYYLVFIYIYKVSYSIYEAQTDASVEMHGVAVDRGGVGSGGGATRCQIWLAAGGGYMGGVV